MTDGGFAVQTAGRRRTPSVATATCVATSVVAVAALAAVVSCNTKHPSAPLLGVAPSAPSVQVGQTVQLVAVGASGLVVWSSSDSATAIVLHGLVTGTSAGTAVITATVGTGTASSMVTVFPASNLVTLDADVQPIFSARCVGCHVTGHAAGGVVLTPADSSRASLVNVRANAVSSFRVLPGDTSNSFLYQEVTATGVDTAGWMPLGCRPGNSRCLDPSLVRIIVEWIEQGAH